VQPFFHLYSVTSAIGCRPGGFQSERLINGKKAAQGLAKHFLFGVAINTLGSRTPGLDSPLRRNGKHRIY
jgi:hypothetical protein